MSKQAENASKSPHANLTKMTYHILDNSLAHTIIAILETPHMLLKSYLIVFVTVTSALAAYMLINASLSYFSYEVITTSRTMFEMPAEFPRVSICNSYIFTTEYALEVLRGINKEIFPNATTDIFNTETMNRRSDFLSRKQISEVTSRVAIRRVNMNSFPDERRKRLGHTIQDILIDCSFNSVTCTASDFTWSFDPVLGNCYSFNTKPNDSRVELKQSSFAGLMYGLRLQLYARFHDNLTFFNLHSKNYYNKYNAHGLFVFIENSTSLVDHTFDGGFRLPSGFETSIKIERRISLNLPKPYSSCDLDNNKAADYHSFLVNLIARSPYGYTQQLCFEQCYQQELVNECNCTDTFALSLFRENICYTANDSVCSGIVWNKVYQNRSFFRHNCLESCPLECNKTDFNTKISFLELMSDEYFVNVILDRRNLSADFVAMPISNEKATNSFVTVNMYYDSLSYSMSTESPQMDLVALLASIGGNLGLFLGVSVFSMGELVQLLLEEEHLLEELLLEELLLEEG